MELKEPWLMQGDCLERMREIPDGSVDMVLCDLPYGVTAFAWDVVIPFEPLWEQYYRVCKPNAAVVLFGKEPFSSKLRLSNEREFRYDWVWEKTIASDFAMAKIRPRLKHEMISVFYRKKPNYFPQMETGTPYVDKRVKTYRPSGINNSALNKRAAIVNNGTRYPSSVQRFGNCNKRSSHPTQKPVALLEYLIRTYTNEGETVLDNCMGSGSTGVAALNTGRRFIGIELDEAFFQTATERIAEAGSTR